MKNRVLRFAAVLTVLAIALALAFVPYVVMKKTQAQSPAAVLSRAVGIYNSQAYAGWGAYILSGNTATGSQTITVCPALYALPDGRVVQPLSGANGVFPPITVDPESSSVSETVTPTAYSLINPPPAGAASPSVPCANITASFSNLHGNSYFQSQVISGDQGIQEAINDAALSGGGQVFWQIDAGSVTLNTGGLNTTLGSINIPTRSTVLGATARVTTTITACSGGWGLGYSTGVEFAATNTTLTAGTTTDSSTLVPAVAFNASATPPIAHCTTSNASAGAIHARVWGLKMAPPAF